MNITSDLGQTDPLISPRKLMSRGSRMSSSPHYSNWSYQINSIGDNMHLVQTFKIYESALRPTKPNKFSENRKVDEKVIDLLGALSLKKETSEQVQHLQNRIKFLQKEEFKTKTRINRSEKLVRAILAKRNQQRTVGFRIKFLKEQERLSKAKQNEKEEEEKRRREFAIQKFNQEQKKIEIQNNIYGKKRKDVIKSKREFDRKKKQIQEQKLQLARKKKEEAKSERLKASPRLLSPRIGYDVKITKEKEEIQKNINNIKKLEKAETDLMTKIKKTYELQEAKYRTIDLILQERTISPRSLETSRCRTIIDDSEASFAQRSKSFVKRNHVVTPKYGITVLSPQISKLFNKKRQKHKRILLSATSRERVRRNEEDKNDSFMDTLESPIGNARSANRGNHIGEDFQNLEGFQTIEVDLDIVRDRISRKNQPLPKPSKAYESIPDDSS